MMRRRPLALLILSVFLGVAAALYPYSPAVNPEGKGVGVDIHYYVDNGELVEKDISQAFKVMKGSRPIIFLLIYGLQKLIGSDVSTVVKFLPVILNPLMIATASFLAYEAFRDEWIAGWTSFFTACGYQVTVGMYSYFLTNMLALSLAFLSLGFLFRSLRRVCKVSLALASILGILLIFTHPWTFDQYYAAMALTTAISWYKDRESATRLKMMFLYLVSLGLADIFKPLIFGGIEGLSAVSIALWGFESISGFWISSIFSFRLMYGGLLSNLILLSLALVGVYLMERNETPEIFLTILLGITSLFFLIGNEHHKSRLLYNIPIGLFVALGFKSIFRCKISENLNRILIPFVILNFMVYLFRSLTNLI